jgi:iron complex transport system permease protein
LTLSNLPAEPAHDNPPGARRSPAGSIASLVLLLAAVLLAVVVVGLLAGRYPKPGLISPARLANDPFALQLVLLLRAPRVLAAIALGAGLAVSGFVLQMLFGNPLVEPGLIGVSQGGAFGAALMMVLLAAPLWLVQIASTAGGAVGLLLSYRIARRFRFGGWTLRLVLAGISVSAVFSAGVGLLKFVADPMSELPAITFWLLGGLSATTWPRLLQILPLVAVGMLVIAARAWRINVLATEDRIAFSLGTAPARERAVLLVAATAVTAALVAMAGIVGWVGLLVPHIARRLVGADAKRVLPVAALTGAIFVLAGDTLARTLIAGEIPLGIVTSLLGAGGFIALLSRSRVRIAK